MKLPHAQKVEKVMHEFKEGALHSGGSGKVVKSPKQAIAIALSEARKRRMAQGGEIEIKDHPMSDECYAEGGVCMAHGGMILPQDGTESLQEHELPVLPDLDNPHEGPGEQPPHMMHMIMESVRKRHKGSK